MKLILQTQNNFLTVSLSQPLILLQRHGVKVDLLALDTFPVTLDTFQSLKQDKHTIVQLGSIKALTSVFCILRIQSLFPEIVNTVIGFGLTIVTVVQGLEVKGIPVDCGRIRRPTKCPLLTTQILGTQYLQYFSFVQTVNWDSLCDIDKRF